jgi:hypothetical protein
MVISDVDLALLDEQRVNGTVLPPIGALRCRVCVFGMAICAAVAQRTLCDFA